MQKKKIAALVVCSFLVLVLAGCGNGDKASNGQSIKDQSDKQGTGMRKDDATGQDKGVPTEAITACDGKSEGDSCEMTMPSRDENSSEKQLTGTCKKSQSADTLSCMPQGGGQGGPGGQKGQKPDNAPVQE